MHSGFKVKKLRVSKTAIMQGKYLALWRPLANKSKL